MGVAAGDLDGDGLIDLAVTNFYGESTTFYRNLGGGVFTDATASVGLAVASRRLLGFGVGLLDANNDGRLDLASANGHVNDLRPNYPYRMPAQLLLGGADGRLTDVSDRAGAPWQVPRMGRGLAVGDLDNDGREDVLILSHNQPLAYLHNRTEGGRFLTLRLEGRAVEPRRRRGEGRRRRRRPAPRGLARRRRQLPVGLRPAAPLRPRRSRSDRGRRGHLAIGTNRPAIGGSGPIPATCCARGISRGRWRDFPEPPSDLRESSAGAGGQRPPQSSGILTDLDRICYDAIAADERPRQPDTPVPLLRSHGDASAIDAGRSIVGTSPKGLSEGCGLRRDDRDPQLAGVCRDPGR